MTSKLKLQLLIGTILTHIVAFAAGIWFASRLIGDHLNQ